MTNERVVYLGRLVAGRFVQLARCRRGLIAKRRGVASDSAHDANYRVTSFVTTSSPGDVTGHVTRSAACRVLGDSLSFFLKIYRSTLADDIAHVYSDPILDSFSK